ncbi:pectinesterase-like [Sesamum indicum]|uniref:Pectinesterase n=1 Tax=Sesamum indicum TaxID=4182 RepID=A0A6I9U1L6_SESIN|nr:pectinesterase-like [Sesamum indicum]
MESRNIIKNSIFSKKLSKTHRKLIVLIVLLPLAAVLVSLLLKNSTSSSHSRNHLPPLTPSLAFPLHSFIKKACPETLYSSLCRSTLSTLPKSKNFTSFLKILEFTINRTASHVKGARYSIVAHFTKQDLNLHEKNALRDCMEMLDQTLYELQQATNELRSFASLTGYRLDRLYGNIKNLLSAAMTNENTCINGFLDLEELDSDTRKGHREHLQNFLTPISHMISNSLALIKHVEKKSIQEMVKKPKMMITKGLQEELPDYKRIVRGRKKNTLRKLRPYATVASDGSGNYSTIRDAIAAAPNMSTSIYKIKIMAGIYKENVLIPREKINIMLIGDGMNSTIITGSRNFVDGFSTFESATLTVLGDKFLARDLTIKNTAPPEKHQAVALRVTSNAAFYRCEIVSHQDTLYAHSLRQYYQDCLIQGTIDFIFGNAAAVFQNCTILVRKPIPGQSNMITAQGREDPNQNTGISLQNCTIEAAKEFNLTQRRNISTYLGRPWRNYSRTIVVNSYLGDLIHPRGWFEWDEYSNLDTVEYIEYMNSGPGADTRRRISWAGYRKNCTEDMVRQFTAEEFLHGADDWLESTVFPLFAVLYHQET